VKKALGRSPESWLPMADNYDLWQAKRIANLSEVRKIRFAANA
jgi:plasmid maintenance system antidote protein VapI